MDEKQLEILAKMTYGAYGSETDFKNYQGLPMPKWEELPDKIREAWEAAAFYAFTQGEGAANTAHLIDPNHK